MNYLAEMLRDCSKSRLASFTQLSFPIIQQIQTKIKNKNISLRKKMKQRLMDRQKINKYEEKRQQLNGLTKKDSNNNQKLEKQTVNYMEAYDDQKIFQQNKGNFVQLDEANLDQKQSQITFNIYILMRKRKNIFKIEQVKRKLKNKENLRRMSLKQCDCCEKIGKHRCSHKFCEGRCVKLRRGERIQAIIMPDDYDEQIQAMAIELAQQLIDDKVKQQDALINVIRIVQKEEEALTIPKIDITEKEQMKEQLDPEILNQRQRISENQSKSDISDSKRNKGAEFIKQHVRQANLQQEYPIIQSYRKRSDTMK